MLIHRYHADLRVYAVSVHALTEAIGANFSEALKRANRAHFIFERAREQLNTHLREHRCFEGAKS